MAKKKGWIVLVVIVLVIAVVGAGVAIHAPARNWVGEQFNNLKDLFKSEEKKNEEKKEELKEQIKSDDRYKELDDDNKQKVEEKFEQITNSDEFKEKTDKEKDEIIDKLVESEKIQQDIQKEQEEQETRKEELKQELGEMSEELNNILTSEEELTQSEQVAQVADAINNTKNELKDIINSETATAEEIAEAQEKLEKVEKAEQEYAHDAISNGIKGTSSNCYGLNNKIDIIKINSIYSITGNAFVNCDYIIAEDINGVSIYSKNNGFFMIQGVDRISNELSYDEIVDSISVYFATIYDRTCTNRNAESHKQFLEQNKSEINEWQFDYFERRGYDVSILESWENDGDSDHPEYIIQATRDDIVKIYMMTYDGESYRTSKLEKICPEFWAQKEAEEAKAQNELETDPLNEIRLLYI